MACERELCTFICVLAVVRDKAPSFRHCIICEITTHCYFRSYDPKRHCSVGPFCLTSAAEVTVRVVTPTV